MFSDVDLPVRKKTFQKTLQKMFEIEEQCVCDFIFILFWRSTGNVSEIDRSIAIDGLATAGLRGLSSMGVCPLWGSVLYRGLSNMGVCPLWGSGPCGPSVLYGGLAHVDPLSSMGVRPMWTLCPPWGSGPCGPSVLYGGLAHVDPLSSMGVRPMWTLCPLWGSGPCGPSVPHGGPAHVDPLSSMGVRPMWTLCPPCSVR